MDRSSINRDRIVELARAWLGTPYHHQASLKGVGADCIGLIRGVYAELYGIEVRPVPYSPDWGDHDGNESVIAAGEEYLEPIGLEEAGRGDVVAIRWISRGVAKHAAVLTDPGWMLHSYNGAGVVEVSISDFWRRKFVRAFRFPGVV